MTRAEILRLRSAQHLASVKFCKGCVRELPISQYNKCSQSTDGLAFRCRKCSKAQQKKSRDKLKAGRQAIGSTESA